MASYMVLRGMSETEMDYCLALKMSAIHKKGKRTYQREKHKML